MISNYFYKSITFPNWFSVCGRPAVLPSSRVFILQEYSFLRILGICESSHWIQKSQQKGVAVTKTFILDLCHVKSLDFDVKTTGVMIKAK